MATDRCPSARSGSSSRVTVFSPPSVPPGTEFPGTAGMSPADDHVVPPSML